MTPALTPDGKPSGDEREAARVIWEQLKRGESEAFEQAPENIRAAIFEESKKALQNGDEPDAANPFEDEGASFPALSGVL